MCTNTNPFHHWLWLLDYVLIKSCITPPSPAFYVGNRCVYFQRDFQILTCPTTGQLSCSPQCILNEYRPKKDIFPLFVYVFVFLVLFWHVFVGTMTICFHQQLFEKKMSQPMQLFPLQNHVCVPLWPKVLDSSALVSLCTDSFNIHCTWLNLQLLCNILLRNS